MKRLSTFLMALLLMSIGANAADEVTLQNPSFETPAVADLDPDTGNRAADGSGAYVITADNLLQTGWTLTNAPSVCDIMTADATATDNDFGAPGTPSEGDQMLYLRTAWNNGATTTKLTQEVALPEGRYKLTVDSKCVLYSSGNGSARLVVGDESVELHTHLKSLPTVWDTASKTFDVGSGGATVTIGVEVDFADNQSGFSVLLDNFTLTAVNKMELVAHEEEAESSHWTTTGNNGYLRLNDWSTETDGSGMTVPFCENWVWIGDNSSSYETLTTATISHKTLAGLPGGTYEVSMDIRIFSEAGNAIGSGTTFKANDASEDLDNTTLDGHEGTYGENEETEVYGNYKLTCTVGADGLLDISLQLPDSPTYNWISWKNLRVVMDTEDYPELTAPTGDMAPTVQEAMEAALTAYSNSPSGDNFFAAIEAIQDAYASIAAYAADLNGKDFLIMNSDGYYLAGGLDYGTHAILGGKPQFITFEAQTDGTYMLDTHQYNYGNHYFGTASTTTASSTDFYFDALYPLNWTVEEVDGGGYLISNTTVGYIKGAGFQNGIVTTTDPSDATVWTLVTKDDVIAKMENATVDNPVDVTALIPAPEPKHNNWENSWTMTAYDGYSTIGNGTLGQDGNTASCAETWHSSNGFDMHQIVTFPMAGYYILSAQAFHDLAAWGSDIYPSMYAGDRSVEIYHGTVSSTGGVTDMANAYQDLLKGLHPLSLCLYVEEDNTNLTVGFTSNYAGGDVWTVFGELGLQYLGNDSYEGFVVHEEEAEVGDWSITSTGTFHLNNWSTEADPSGMVVPFMEYWCGSGSTLAAATISHEQLTGLYPGVYEVSLDIRVLNENSGKVTEGTLFKANDASEDLVTGTDANDDTFSNSDDVYGTYTLTCVVDANGTLDISIEIPDDVTYDWIAFKNLKVTYLGDLTVEWDMTAAEWGTLILPFAATVPSGLTAYTIGSVTTDEEDDGIAATLSLTESGSIAANTPYIMGGTENTYTFTGTPTNTANSYTITPVTGVSLTGTFVDMSLANSDFTTTGNQYVLQNHEEGGLAFYPITTESVSSGVTLGAYHCYLTYSNAGEVKGFISFAGTDDEATAIEAVEGAEAEANGAIYDLSGRKVSKAVKGVYIQNGKKVLVK